MKEEFQYFATLVVSVGLGWIVGRLPAGPARQWLCSGSGLLLLVTFCGFDALHPLITILVNAAIILTMG